MDWANIDIKPLVDSTPIKNDAKALQAAARENGYLFFKGLLNPDKLLNLRKQFVDILESNGFIRPGTNPMDAITDHEPVSEGHAEFLPIFNSFQRLEDFHAMAHDPAIIDVLGRFFGEGVLAHPRNIGRVMIPGVPYTPPHQDYLHIRGTKDTYTAWIPMGDIPVELGGLAILAGSHASGELPVVSMPGAGGAGIEDENLQGEWHSTEYELGDAIFVHSLCVHASRPNQFPDRIRLSLDYRYQPMSHEVDKTSLLPHMRRSTWDEIYANWSEKSAPYQYYWKDMPLNVTDPRGVASGY